MTLRDPNPKRKPTASGAARSAITPPFVASPLAPPAPSTPVVDPRVAALALIPSGSFVLTSAYGESRGGVIVRWVQQVSACPLLVVVAIEKGQPLSPIIRDSRRFALCQLAADDRVLRRLFESHRVEPYTRQETIDPFLGLATMTTAGGVPVPMKSQSWLDCELTRHLDVEGNCELYIGLVHAGGVLRDPAPAPSPPANAAPIPGRDEPKVARPTTPATNGHHATATSVNGGNGKSNGNGHANGHANGKRRPQG